MTSPAQHDRQPLVEPGAPLCAQSLIRYSRQLANPDFGELAQRRLANARVLVVGAGGLGSATIPALTAMGVGTIGGMLIGTLALLFIVPALFVIFQTIEEKVITFRPPEDYGRLKIVRVRGEFGDYSIGGKVGQAWNAGMDLMKK